MEEDHINCISRVVLIINTIKKTWISSSKSCARSKWKSHNCKLLQRSYFFETKGSGTSNSIILNVALDHCVLCTVSTFMFHASKFLLYKVQPTRETGDTFLLPPFIKTKSPYQKHVDNNENNKQFTGYCCRNNLDNSVHIMVKRQIAWSRYMTISLRVWIRELNFS